MSLYKELPLPSLSASLLLQPFLPIISFPSYFSKLHAFTSDLERHCRGRGVDYATVNIMRLSSQGLALRKGVSSADLEPILNFISEKLESLLEVVSEEGFPLLLLHLFPFFQYPQSSFDAVYSFLPLLTQHMSRRSVGRVFSSVIIRLFDTATEPHHRGQLYSRTTSDLILKRFGLTVYLNRFLGFLIEAVLEPLRQTSKTSSNKRHNSNIVRLKSQSVMTLMASSDGLPSQTFSSPDPRDLSTNLSYSMGVSDHAYNDSDKDYSSSEDSESEECDSGGMTECSLLAKSSILSGGEGRGETMAANDAMNISQSPLVMAAERAAIASSSSSGSGSGKWQSDREAWQGIDHPLAESLSSPEAKDGRHRTGSVEDTLPVLSEEQQQLLSLQDSVALGGSSKYDPTQSLISSMSEDSLGNEIKFSSLPPSALGGMVGQRDRVPPTFPGGLQLSLPLRTSSYDRFSGSGSREGSMVNMGSNGEEEEEGVANNEEAGEIPEDCQSDEDPGVRAINLRVSKIAGDCLCWLLRRLGPILATKHIVQPLIERLHCCFTGIVDRKGKEVAALRCLASFAECYGDVVVLRMYLPHAENMVRDFCDSCYR